MLWKKLAYFMPSSLFLFPAVQAQAKIVALTHVTDPQWTFSRSGLRPQGDQIEDGALAVAGTELTHEKILAAVKAALAHGKIKLSLSGDAHFPEELGDADQNGEFHAPFHFPRHGMRGESGPHGDRLIVGLEELLPEELQLRIPAHEPVDGQLRPVPFSLEDIELERTDRVLRFEKNGVGSYSVFVNPRYRLYLEKMNPRQDLPHFHLGWCSDFCTYSVVKGELELGYRVYVLIDAIAGVFPKKTGQALRDLAASGALFMKTSEYVDLLAQWSEENLDAAAVQSSLAKWQSRSTTHSQVLQELQDPRYADPAENEVEAHGQCAVLLLAGNEDRSL